VVFSFSRVATSHKSSFCESHSAQLNSPATSYASVAFWYRPLPPPGSALYSDCSSHPARLDSFRFPCGPLVAVRQRPFVHAVRSLFPRERVRQRLEQSSFPRLPSTGLLVRPRRHRCPGRTRVPHGTGNLPLTRLA